MLLFLSSDADAIRLKKLGVFILYSFKLIVFILGKHYIFMSEIYIFNSNGLFCENICLEVTKTHVYKFGDNTKQYLTLYSLDKIFPERGIIS